MTAPRPPETCPDDLRDAFTMGGRALLEQWYLDDSSESVITYTAAQIDEMVENAKAGRTGTYGPMNGYLRSAFRDAPLAGRHVAVMGSRSPWFEAMCLVEGASRVTIIEYTRIDVAHPQVVSMTPAEYAASPQLFDAIVSISSFEHDGLGRYGDPVDPDGDLKAMERCAAMLNGEGVMFLAVPVGIDTVVWNAHRVYGKHRLPLLLSQWDAVRWYGLSDGDMNTTHNPVHQPVAVLRPKK